MTYTANFNFNFNFNLNFNCVIRSYALVLSNKYARPVIPKVQCAKNAHVSPSDVEDIMSSSSLERSLQLHRNVISKRMFFSLWGVRDENHGKQCNSQVYIVNTLEIEDENEKIDS